MQLQMFNLFWLASIARHKVIKMFVFLFLPILAATLVTAAESGRPPKVDIQATCRASENEIKKLLGNDSTVTFGGCLNQENSAFEQLVKDWATYPAADKTQCVQQHAYMPSYVEWVTCLEIQKDLRRIRAEEKSDGARPERARNRRN